MTGLASLLGNRKAVAGPALLLAFAVLALVGPALVGDPTDFVARPFDPPSAAHWLGTTGRGQDVFWQTVAGARPTLAGGLPGRAWSWWRWARLVGAAAGYLGGWLDDLLSLLINIFLVIPGLPLMVVVAAYLPPARAPSPLVLIFTGWAWTARVVRAQTLALPPRDFVAAAVVVGREPPAHRAGGDPAQHGAAAAVVVRRAPCCTPSAPRWGWSSWAWATSSGSAGAPSSTGRATTPP